MKAVKETAKTCPSCGELKTTELFSKNRNSKDGRAWACKPCTWAQQRELRYIKDYGITLAEYDQFLLRQSGACAICSRPPVRNRLAVDHDHATGVVRGLLCSRCNQHLEWFIDYQDKIKEYKDETKS